MSGHSIRGRPQCSYPVGIREDPRVGPPGMVAYTKVFPTYRFNLWGRIRNGAISRNGLCVNCSTRQPVPSGRTGTGIISRPPRRYEPFSLDQQTTTEKHFLQYLPRSNLIFFLHVKECGSHDPQRSKHHVQERNRKHEKHASRKGKRHLFVSKNIPDPFHNR